MHSRAVQTLQAPADRWAPPVASGSWCLWQRPPPVPEHPVVRRRRSTLTPPAACAASDSTSSAESRHFLRPSLLATGLTEPQDVLQHCLALFRKADLASLRQYLPPSYATATDAAAAGSPATPAGPWQQVAEQGPLAPLAGVLDVGARRVLPGHLLRRSQVLSSLRPSPDTFQQRIALSACTGETSVFEWLLRWHSDQGQAAGPSSSRSSTAGRSGGSGGSGSVTAGGRWVLESVRRDANADVPLPTTPHPKCAPEAIVKAQLAALQQGDVFGASCYSMWHGKGLSSRKTSLGYHHDALRSRLAQPPYSLLLRHAAARLGAAALPSQREQLLEVGVLAADGTSARFLWRLSMATHGCWMTSGIFAAEELPPDALPPPQQQGQ